jgi:hypothetical protein
MKIRLLRASNTIKEIEFAATLPALEIQRLAVDLMFENFERNQTHFWPREEDTRGARHEIQVLSDDGTLLKSFVFAKLQKKLVSNFLAAEWMSRPERSDG